MAHVIFDLDGTVIDSSHRHATKADGSIDLAHWFENAKPNKIMKDKLLPLAESMRRMYDAGHNIIICTARCLQWADRQFLIDHKLRHHALLSRKGYFVDVNDPERENSYHGFIGDARGDAEMKLDLLEEYFRSLGFRDMAQAEPIMFDDNLKVLAEMQRNGCHAINATRWNAKIMERAA